MAVKRAGSFEALRPHLRAKRILARYHQTRTWPELKPNGGPGEFPPYWWDYARLDPATGRLVINMPDTQLHIPELRAEPFVRPGYEMCVLGIKLERTVPMARKSASPKEPRRKRGAKQSAAWDPLLKHLDAMIARGEIANHAEAFDEGRRWLDKNNRALSDDALRKGIKRNRPQWFKA